MKVSRFLKGLTATAVFMVGVLSAAEAHTRYYTFTEQYRTIPQNQFEIEQWTKLDVPNRHATNENKWKYQTELEYGITDHWTIAHYEFWETQNVIGNDDATGYGGFKFETKYRIGEKGKYWVDPLVYLEWETEPGENNPNTIEGKIVLSKDLGDLNVTYNQILESQLGEDGRTEPEFAFAASYAVPGGFRPGVEFTGNYWEPGTRRNELALGPSLAWEGKYFWLAGSVVFGINHAADDVQANVVVGVPL
ncbi:MAG TPA: hypothetical protein VL688_00640 [Verrucomicrobiae bacterium]|nr:hypothetical protein [Verrucomicrobiae bacterium]